MKWSVVGLLLLGIGAAVAAAVMVASLKSGGPSVASTFLNPGEVQIMVAAKPIPAMSIVEAESVTTTTVPSNAVPEHSMREPTDVIGRVLIVPVVEGQALTSTFLAHKSLPRVPKGMRLVSLSLAADKAGLVYAGSIVDVLVSLNRPSTEGTGIKEAISINLLQGVEVFAIDGTSVQSETTTSDASATETSDNARRGRRDRLVTLVVKPIDARALQLADEFGDVSLAMRDHLDDTPVEPEPTRLSRLDEVANDAYGRIRDIIMPLLANEPIADVQSQTSNPTQFAQSTPVDGPAGDNAASSTWRDPCAEVRTPLPAGLLAAEKSVVPKSEITVIRGEHTEIDVFRPNGLWWVLDSRTHSGSNR